MSAYRTYLETEVLEATLSAADHERLLLLLEQARMLLTRFEAQRAQIEGPVPSPALPIAELDAGARIELSCCFGNFWQLAAEATAQLSRGHADVVECRRLLGARRASSVGLILEADYFYFEGPQIELAHRVLAELFALAAVVAPPRAHHHPSAPRLPIVDETRIAWPAVAVVGGLTFLAAIGFVLVGWG